MHAVVEIGFATPGHLTRFLDNVLIELLLVEIVTRATDPLIAVALILKKVLTWKPITQLIRSWTLLKDLLKDGTYKKSIVTPAAHHVRSLCKLIELAL